MRRSSIPLALITFLSLVPATRTQAGYLGTAPLAGSPTSIVGGINPQASTIVYDNLATFSGYGYAPGGAATTSLGTTTNMVASEITTAPGTGGSQITGLEFTTANFNTASVSAMVVLSFYDTTGTGGGPGNLIGGLEFSALTLAAGEVQAFTYSPGSTIFNVPTSGSFYVGEQFVASGTTTTAQLNNLGLGIFNPPDVGSSPGSFFLGSSAAAPATNPSGTLGYTFGSTGPVANFGFQFSGITPSAVPEPSSILSMSLAGVILACVGARKAANARRLATR
jgi:hypothetical protein